MNKNIIGNITALSAIIFFSTYIIFSKILIEHLPAHTLAALSQALSVIALLFAFGVIPEFKKIYRLPTKSLIILLIMSLLATVVGPLLFLKGLQNTTATNSVLISCLESVFTGIISALWLKEKITRQQFIGTLIMFGGLHLIITKGMSEQIQFNGGDFFIILATISWAMATNIFKKFFHKISPELVVIFRNTVGALVLFFILPYIFNFQHDFSPLTKPEVIIPLILLSVLTIVIAQSLWYKALELIPATRISTISLLSPIFGVTFAVLVLGEKLAAYHFYGGALIIFGLILTVVHHQKHPHHHAHQKIKHHHPH